MNRWVLIIYNIELVVSLIYEEILVLSISHLFYLMADSLCDLGRKKYFVEQNTKMYQNIYAKYSFNSSSSYS
jgi:hypothetical protein